MFVKLVLLVQEFMTDKTTILTVNELCSLLKIGKNTAYGLIHGGEIKAFWIRGQIRIPMENVLEYIEKEQYKGKFGECRQCPDETERSSS